MFQCSLLSVFADDEYTYTVTFYAGNQGTFADGAGKIVMSNLKYELSYLSMYRKMVW